MREDILQSLQKEIYDRCQKNNKSLNIFTIFVNKLMNLSEVS